MSFCGNHRPAGNHLREANEYYFVAAERLRWAGVPIRLKRIGRRLQCDPTPSSSRPPQQCCQMTCSSRDLQLLNAGFRGAVQALSRCNGNTANTRAALLLAGPDCSRSWIMELLLLPQVGVFATTGGPVDQRPLQNLPGDSSDNQGGDNGYHRVQGRKRRVVDEPEQREMPRGKRRRRRLPATPADARRGSQDGAPPTRSGCQHRRR